MIVAVCPKCGADLEALTYTTYPPIHAYRCRKCGWTQEERENITRVPIATVERKPITNADRIRSMSDEELAEFMNHGACPPGEDVSELCYDEDGGAVPDICNLCWFTYLRQEADHV